ncbi:uncharacterized protein LOC127878856 [Dreissena polymorpha]|uniref:Uncharacterized protein n=1 Tax=Dreissena polymorpha TaxID=45954 RepID=A0A9D4K6Z3_DREPO|nr:uncharacterized protein LOC127878856 [Dreissena polymorpha]XP_052281340.1 uncharacterized protein LOC127878856 [Dreissena polymorpha]XP_052281341.1 uncharacterized protein LOC127878856 [Dreissena polymorpha]KAH3834262.1 hypothetical protein DPMN_107582 [Dreissena polymorpha]
MAKMQTLTVENLADHHSDHSGSKRPSLVPKEGSEGSHTINPSKRRMSRFEGRPSVQYSRRMSMVLRSSVTGSSFGIKNIGLFPVKLQNTYKLQPGHSEVFKPESVRVIIQEVLDECLNGETLSPVLFHTNKPSETLKVLCEFYCYCISWFLNRTQSNYIEKVD